MRVSFIFFGLVFLLLAGCMDDGHNRSTYILSEGPEQVEEQEPRKCI